MFINGVITYIPTPEEHAANVAKQREHGRGDGMVAIGLKKRGGRRPTFFRISFINDGDDDMADWVVRNFSDRDKVTVEVEDESVHLSWEMDAIARTSTIIRGRGIGIEPWDGISK